MSRTALAVEGLTVSASGRDEVVTKEAADAIPGARPLAIDVRDDASVRAAEVAGPIDVLVNVPALLDRGHERVVDVSSGAGSFAGGRWTAAPADSVSKAALNALTVVLADRVRGTGVKVNAADPGTVGTRPARDAGRRPGPSACRPCRGRRR